MTQSYQLDNRGPSIDYRTSNIPTNTAINYNSPILYSPSVNRNTATQPYNPYGEPQVRPYDSNTPQPVRNTIPLPQTPSANYVQSPIIENRATNVNQSFDQRTQ